MKYYQKKYLDDRSFCIAHDKKLLVYYQETMPSIVSRWTSLNKELCNKVRTVLYLEFLFDDLYITCDSQIQSSYGLLLHWIDKNKELDNVALEKKLKRFYGSKLRELRQYDIKDIVGRIPEYDFETFLDTYKDVLSLSQQQDLITVYIWNIQELVDFQYSNSKTIVIDILRDLLKYKEIMTKEQVALVFQLIFQNS